MRMQAEFSTSFTSRPLIVAILASTFYTITSLVTAQEPKKPSSSSELVKEGQDRAKVKQDKADNAARDLANKNLARERDAKEKERARQIGNPTKDIGAREKNTKEKSAPDKLLGGDKPAPGNKPSGKEKPSGAFSSER